MKGLYFAICLLLAWNLEAQEDYLEKTEKGVLGLINQMRQDPPNFAEKALKNRRGETVALQKFYKLLKKMEPLEPLRATPELCKITSDVLEKEDGSTFSLAQERAIDIGSATSGWVSKQGHDYVQFLMQKQEQLLSAEYKFIGITISDLTISYMLTSKSEQQKPTSTDSGWHPLRDINSNSNVTRIDSSSGGKSKEEIERAEMGKFFAKWDVEQWEDAAELDNARVLDYMTEDEKFMVREINMMRTQPKRYAVFVDKYIETEIKPKIEKMPTLASKFKKEMKAAQELSQELKTMEPVGILKPHRCVYAAAKAHGQDMAKRMRAAHEGSDGSNSWDRIAKSCSELNYTEIVTADGPVANENLAGDHPGSIRLTVMNVAIDVGLPERGHRKNLLDPDWQYIGCYYAGKAGKNTWDYWWVQNFAE